MHDVDFGLSIGTVVGGCSVIDNTLYLHSTVLRSHTTPSLHAVRIRVWFSNGYGASIITTFGTYGKYYNYDNNIWEVAVLKGDESRYDLCYDTDITNDVVGSLTAVEAVKIAEKISKLPKEA